MVDITMNFGGVDLSPLLTVLKVIRHIGNERELQSVDNRFVGISIKKIFTQPKIIEVSFSIASQNIKTIFTDTVEKNNFITTTLTNLKRELAKIFNVNTPQKLIFSDSDDIFYMAIPTGLVEMEDINDWYSVGRITFNVVDGLAYRKNKLSFRNSGNRLIISNNGGVSVSPQFEFTTASNLKMIAFTLNGNVFKIGSSTGEPIILSGQRVKIDMTDGSIFVGNNKRMYRTFDSKLLVALVGTNNIGIAVNSGATIPIITAYINEAFL